jgi:hypothetical protein
MLANELRDRQFIQVTYNRLIADEVRARSEDIENLRVETYHSLCHRYYSATGYTDDIIISAIKHKGIRMLDTYDVLVVDEAQDMTALYYNFILRFIKDIQVVNPKLKLVLCGDKWQCLYAFKGADSRYLTMGDALFGEAGLGEFERLTLTTSYRLTHSMRFFINRTVLNRDRIATIKSGPKVFYNKISGYSMAGHITTKLIELLKKWKPSDIYILAHSLKNNPITKVIENNIVGLGVNCYYAANDSDSVKIPKLIDNKLVISTIHQAKGCERPVVFYLGFDSNYYKYFGKNEDQTICPSAIYVALTRASHELHVFEDSKSEPLPFITSAMYGYLTNTLFVDYAPKFKHIDDIPRTVVPDPRHRIVVHEFVSYLDSLTLKRAGELVRDMFTVAPVRYDLPLITTIKSVECVTVEMVAHLTGLLVPTLHEVAHTGTSVLCNVVGNCPNDSPIFRAYCHKLLKRVGDGTYEPASTTIEALTKLVIAFSAVGSQLMTEKVGTLNMLRQINDVWITEELREEIVKRMDEEILSEVLSHEVFVQTTWNSMMVIGVLDAVGTATVWEFKYVGEIMTEHLLQLAMYYFINANEALIAAKEHTRIYRLFNVRTGEVWTLDHNFENVGKIFELLYDAKYRVTTQSDSEFMETAKSGMTSFRAESKLDEFRKVCVPTSGMTDGF